MTYQNWLIKQAKARPSKIVIPPHKVRTVVLHAKHSARMYGMTEQDIERELRAGQMKLMGVPLEVQI